MDLIHDGNEGVYDGYPGMGLIRAWEKLRFWWQSNSKTQAKKNIEYHYDLGNDFYRLWLDDTMTYSSARCSAQGRKAWNGRRSRNTKAWSIRWAPKPGDHVLEIGCGWGGFAEYAARERGLRVTSLTISQAQHDYAVERITAAGLSRPGRDQAAGLPRRDVESMTASPASRCSRRWARSTGPSISTRCASG